ncbi:MAG: YqcC family protein [Gammaproteobacteria bacterium]
MADAIEGELRRLGLWEQTPPPAQALMSEQPFCFDTLTFTQWLQWIFLVRVRLLLSEHRTLPQVSDIYPLAEHVFEPLDYDSGPLLRQIRRFDELINSGDQL